MSDMFIETPEPSAPKAHRINTAEDLEALMHQRNDAGLEPMLSGLDANGVPFLADLNGAYAEYSVVLTGYPWSTDYTVGTAQRCTECGASGRELNPHDHLRYPITVLTAPEPTDCP